MEETTTKQPKDGNKKNRKSSEHRDKRRNENGLRGPKERLDGQTVGYYRRVSDMLNEGFPGDEEKGKSD